MNQKRLLEEATELCLKNHREEFYRILRKGQGKVKFGPPCFKCRAEVLNKAGKVTS